MKANVEIRQFVEIEIPDDKINGLMKGYRELIYPEGEENDMVEHIAFTVAINETTFVEGIGPVSKNGRGDSEIRVTYNRSDIEIESNVETAAI